MEPGDWSCTEKVMKVSKPTYSNLDKKELKGGRGHKPHSPPILPSASHWSKPIRSRSQLEGNSYAIPTSWAPRTQSEYGRHRARQMESMSLGEESS